VERLDDTVLLAWLAEDAPFGDLTTRTLGLSAEPGEMRFAARREMRVAAVEEAARLVELAGGRAVVRVPTGADAAAGQTLLDAEGPAAGLLLAWKVAQTSMEIAGGIATEAARIVRGVREAGYRVPLACTRKTYPGGRALAVRAATAGGAVMHRLGLSETLLVFPEHRAFLPPEQIAPAVAAAQAAAPEKKLVAETSDADEAHLLAAAGADVLQLERFAPEELAALRARLDSAGLHPLLAPAGGVTAANAVAYAAAGADVLVSSAPYLAPPADVQVTIGRA
jgi:molybdenum transport protein